MKRTSRLLVVTVFAALLSGCAGAGRNDPTTPRLEARPDMVVSAEWLVQRLDDPSVVIVHVAGTREVYDALHIPEARFVAWDEVATERNGIPNELPPIEDLVKLVRRLGIDSGDRIVLYDEQGGLMAARAWIALEYVGLGGRASLLQEDWREWRAGMRPLSNAVPQPKPSDYVPRPHPEVIVRLPEVRDAVWALADNRKAPVRLVDARPEAQYAGTEPGEGVRRGGHIPGAISMFWERHLQAPSEAGKGGMTLRSPAELRSLYEKAGLRPDDLVIAYCRTGGQASHAYFVLKYLGYHAHLYDGSYIEWSGAADTDVVAGQELR